MITLSAPRGVTSIGGAKVYAAKFATTQRCHTLESECERRTYLHQRLLDQCHQTRRMHTRECSHSHVDIPAHHIGFRRYV